MVQVQRAFVKLDYERNWQSAQNASQRVVRRFIQSSMMPQTTEGKNLVYVSFVIFARSFEQRVMFRPSTTKSNNSTALMHHDRTKTCLHVCAFSLTLPRMPSDKSFTNLCSDSPSIH